MRKYQLFKVAEVTPTTGISTSNMHCGSMEPEDLSEGTSNFFGSGKHNTSGEAMKLRLSLHWGRIVVSSAMLHTSRVRQMQGRADGTRKHITLESCNWWVFAFGNFALEGFTFKGFIFKGFTFKGFALSIFCGWSTQIWLCSSPCSILWSNRFQRRPARVVLCSAVWAKPGFPKAKAKK